MLRSLAAALALTVIALTAAAANAEPERRVALVIGNSAYQHLPRLANPVKDAELMATTLKSVGFQLIGGKAQTDLDRSGFEGAIRQFGAELKDGAVGLFYYAGHGLQVQGANFLVPVAADPITVADVDFELIDANVVLKQMEAAGSKLNLVILDACRNNPFGGRGLRDASSGLAPMRAPRGTLISYATQPGNTAMDGTIGHSPYTAALAEAIKRPGRQAFEVFNDVALSVDKMTGGRQQPWIAISPLEGTFYFLGPTTVNITPPKLRTDEETVFWQSIAQSKNIADFQEYLRKYPNGHFTRLAENRLTALQLAADPELAFWRQIEESNKPDDFDEYLRRYPNGRFTGGAEARLSKLRPIRISPPPPRRSDQPQIVITANQDCWMQVRDGRDEVIFSRVLKPGESYRVPQRSGLSLRTGNAGALQIWVDGKLVPSVGAFGTFRRNVRLEPTALVGGTAVQD